MKKQFLYLFVMVAIAVSSCTKDSDNSPEGTPLFEMSSDQLFLEQEVAFTNLSENAEVYRWDFGDGNRSSEKDPVHKYTTAGEYSVSLQVGPSTVLVKKLTVHDGDRAVYLVNGLDKDVEVTLFDRVLTDEIGRKRYHLGLVMSSAVSDTLYIKDEALGISGVQDGTRSFVIFDPLAFELEKGKVNKLEINAESKIVFGFPLPEIK